MPNSILVIDDDPITLAFHGAILRGAGYDVIEAADGPSALACMAVGQVAGIVCDFHMARMNGVEFVKAIRTQPQYNSVPILMVSADKSDVSLDDPYLAGAIAWMQKPVSAQDLRTVVRIMLTEAKDGPSDKPAEEVPKSPL